LQEYPKAVFDYVRDHWDQPLTPELVVRIGRVSDSEFENFLLGWPEGTTKDAPALRPGQQRPVVSSTNRLEPAATGAAAALLLHVESVLLPATFLIPGFQLGDDWELGRTYSWPTIELPKEDQDWRRIAILYRLDRLARLRPLVEEHLAYFGPDPYAVGRPTTIDNLDGYRNPVLLDPLNWVGTRFEQDFDGRWEEISKIYYDLREAMKMAELGIATVVARSNEERHFLERFGSRQQSETTRAIRLERLSRSFQLPNLSTDITTVVDLRRSGVFSTWRMALTQALDSLGGIPESTEGVAAARAILADELRMNLSDLTSEVAQSPFLTSLQSGWRKMLVSAFSGGLQGVSQADMSIPGPFVAGGVAGAGLGVLDSAMNEYLDAVEARGRGLAIMRAILSFEDSEIASS